MPTRAIAGGQGRVRTGRIVGPTGTPGVLIGQMIGNPLWNGAMTVIPPVALVGNIAGAGAWAGALTVGSAVSPAFQTDFTAISSLPTGISLSRATGGTRINSSGVRVTEAVNAPRFDYSYNGSVWVPRGLLIEEQRANLPKDSGDQTTANWTKFGCAASTSATTGADNSNFMTLITANSGGNVKEIYSSSPAVVTPDANHALSVDLKKTNWNYIFLAFQSDISGHWVCIVVDLSTNTVTQTGVGGNSGTLVGTPTVTPLRNGIVRVEFIAAQSTNSGYVVPGFAGAATGNTMGAGDGSIATTMAGTETFLVDAAQLSPGSTPTSYIPTTSAAVTRSADIVSLAGAADTAAKSGVGTFLVEVGELPSALGSTNACILTSANYFPIFRDAVTDKPSNSGFHAPGAATQNAAPAGGWTVPNRIGLAYDATSMSLVTDGGTVATATGTGDWASDGTIYLGGYVAGAQSINGHLRSFAIYSSRLSDATLQAKSVVGAAF